MLPKRRDRLFFFFVFILFYFLTLQYCIGFAIYQHASATGIHVFPILNPPPSLYHPSGSSQSTSPKHPVSCIEPGLAIRFIYDIIHISMPFSQIIPPSPSPTESKRHPFDAYPKALVPELIFIYLFIFFGEHPIYTITLTFVH